MWYQFKIDFADGFDQNYTGLGNHQWRITVNGTEYGVYDYLKLEVDLFRKTYRANSIPVDIEQYHLTGM